MHHFSVVVFINVLFGSDSVIDDVIGSSFHVQFQFSRQSRVRAHFQRGRSWPQLWSPQRHIAGHITRGSCSGLGTRTTTTKTRLGRTANRLLLVITAHLGVGSILFATQRLLRWYLTNNSTPVVVEKLTIMPALFGSNIPLGFDHVLMSCDFHQFQQLK